MTSRSSHASAERTYWFGVLAECERLGPEYATFLTMMRERWTRNDGMGCASGSNLPRADRTALQRILQRHKADAA